MYPNRNTNNPPVNISFLVIFLIIALLIFWDIKPTKIDFNFEQEKNNLKVNVTGLNLSKQNLTLNIGQTEKIIAGVTPNNATNKKITWISSNQKVAKVENGKITAVGEGTATITATTKDGGYNAQCTIKVKKKTMPVTGITLNTNKLELNINRTATLITNITPLNATNKQIIWTSSNPNVAKVENGKIIAVGEGTTTITATTKDGGYNAQCITIVKKTKTPVTGITLNKSELKLKVNGTASLTASISPINAPNKNITWTSSNQNVAKVENGKVIAVGEGTATITATTQDGGHKAQCVTIVKQPTIQVTGITLNTSKLDLKVNGIAVLIASINPTNATNKNIIWTSSNKNVAKVENGNITAVGEGTVIITAQTQDGGYKSQCTVTVKKAIIPVSKIVLNTSKIELNLNGTTTLIASIMPTNATNKNVTWTSSNQNVAKVENGKITAVGVGTATITATTQDGRYKAQCIITVKKSTIPVTKITLNTSKIELKVNGTATITTSISPTNAANKNITWTSSNPNVVKVINGKITAVGVGTATITATTQDGGHKAQCTITVVQPVTGISINPTSKTLNVGGTVTLKSTISPTNATNKNITWTSSNTKIAKVTNGKVTAVGVGTATITAKTQDGSYTATTKINVKNTVKIHFIKQSGSADAILLESNGHYAMIDTGLLKDKQTTLNYLSARGVEKLDFLLITHNHGDHLGGGTPLLNSKIKIDKIFIKQYFGEGYDEDYETNKPRYDKFIKAAQDKNITRIYINRRTEGYEIKFDKMNIYLYNIGYPSKTTATKSENFNSVSQYILINGTKTFLTSDISYTKVLNSVLESNKNIKEIDVLKAPHHAYNSCGVNNDIAKKLQPKTLVITNSEVKTNCITIFNEVAKTTQYEEKKYFVNKRTNSLIVDYSKVFDTNNKNDIVITKN